MGISEAKRWILLSVLEQIVKQDRIFTKDTKIIKVNYSLRINQHVLLSPFRQVHFPDAFESTTRLKHKDDPKAPL